jgi:hypothetical protein
MRSMEMDAIVGVHARHAGQLAILRVWWILREESELCVSGWSDEGRKSEGGVVVSTNAIPVAYRLSHGGVDRRWGGQGDRLGLT